MSVKLSVNINKIATLRNSRGGSNPNVLQAAIDCQRFGADGITVHPRPDERHIRYADVRDIAPIITTEFNIEGNPREHKFVDLVLEVKPAQVTLVPDEPGQLTSNHGWDTIKEKNYLRDIADVFHKAGIRVSIFTDPVESIVAAAADTGTDRVELYTEDYARHYGQNREHAIAAYVAAAKTAAACGLGLNAGHDLDRDNLGYFATHIPGLLEVSIGHALIADALYYGLENSIQMYRRALHQFMSNR
jgi:pyridoxine 5-phosphate synthase